MSRKLLMIPAALLGAFLFLNASSASAHPHYRPAYPIVRTGGCTPVIVTPIAARFQVLYRPSCNAPWATYNTYLSERFALDVASSLRHQSFEVRIVPI